MGQVEAKLDARSANAATSPMVKFVFQHLESFKPEEKSMAEAHTASLVRRLEADALSAVSVKERSAAFAPQTTAAAASSGGSGGDAAGSSAASSKKQSKKKKKDKKKASAAAERYSPETAVAEEAGSEKEMRGSVAAIHEAGGLKSKAALFQAGGGGSLEEVAEKGESRSQRDSVAALQDSGAVKSASDAFLTQGWLPQEAQFASTFSDDDRSSMQEPPMPQGGAYNV